MKTPVSLGLAGRPLDGRRDAGRYGGPEGRKNGSPWREPWVRRCSGFRAPEGRSESTAVGLVFGGTQDVLPAPVFLIAPPGLLVSFGPCPHGSRRGLVFFRPVRGWESEGSWEAPCSKMTCSRAMNRGLRGARRPPLRQARRPPRPMHGSWEAATIYDSRIGTLNRGLRGARRPPLRQARRPPLRTHGSWEGQVRRWTPIPPRLTTGGCRAAGVARRGLEAGRGRPRRGRRGRSRRRPWRRRWSSRARGRGEVRRRY